MKKKKYELALDFINTKTGSMVSCDDVSIACGMSKNYSAKLLDCIFYVAGGETKSLGHRIIYLFKFKVTLTDIEPYLSKCREAQAIRRLKF